MMSSTLKDKSEEILLKWRQNGWADRWYESYGIEPVKKVMQEIPNDRDLESLLHQMLERAKNEDEKIAKRYNEEWWTYQLAAMRAWREEAKRIYGLHQIHRY